MISRRQQTSASLVKPRDSTTVRSGQPVASLNSEEPELMKVAGIERAQYGVVALRVRLPITRRHLINPGATLIFYGLEIFGQQRKPVDRPIVFDRRNRRLQQDMNSL